MARNKMCLVFSSNPDQGAKNISFNGSKFTVFHEGYPFYVGSETSTNCTIEVIGASIWNSQPNIGPNYNNNRFVVYDNKSQSRKIDISIPTGQYDLTGLVAQLDLQWNSYSGIDTSDNKAFTPADTFQNSFTVSGSDSTQLISIQFIPVNPNLYIDWNLSTLGKLLGFSPASKSHPDIENGYLIGDSTASFNSINSYYLSTDLVPQGLNINGKYGNVIAIIPISSLPGNLVNFQGNFNNLFVACDNILGRRNGKTQTTFWLSDEKMRPLDMNGESYSFTILVRWTD